MNYFQEIIIELQNAGCAYMMENLDLNQLSAQIRNNPSNNGVIVTCEEAVKSFKPSIEIDKSNSIYYEKLFNIYNLLIEKIVAMMCLDGQLDPEKIINFLSMMKNTVCNTTNNIPPTSIENSLYFKYSKYEKNGREIMNYFQEIITELQNAVCAYMMANFDLEEFKIEVRNDFDGKVITCEEAVKMLKGYMELPETSDSIHFEKTLNLVNLLIEKIIAMSCLNGQIDPNKIINLVVMMKNTLCESSEASLLTVAETQTST